MPVDIVEFNGSIHKMLVPLLLLALGLALLIKGADFLVDGASDIARRFYISELTIGLTIVAFGTSLPELTVNVFSSFSGANDIAIGNIIGSNISNILLILGVCAILAPLTVQTSTVWKELPLSLLAALVIFTMANDHIVDHYPVAELSRSDGLTLIGFFLIFLWYTFGMKKADDAGETEASHRHLWISLGMLLVGLLMLVVGGKLAVDAAVKIAEAFGVSQALIGLTVVAVGTSLPELATSAVAAKKGKADIAVGNIVGSNIFNLFWILGVSASIHPLTFQPAMNTDILMMIAATVLLFFAVHTGYAHQRLVFWKQKEGHVIERSDGVMMLLLYIAYTVYLVWRG